MALDPTLKRKWRIEFKCRNGEWEPCNWKGEVQRKEDGSYDYDVYQVRCTLCGHILVHNQVAWQIRHYWNKHRS